MSKRASLSWWCWLALLALTESATAQTTITVDPATRFQTWTGWECVSFAAQDDLAFPAFKDTLFDRVINEAGINRVRLEVRSGAENSTDYFALYQSGQVEYAIWRANRYATVNDNADPGVINEAELQTWSFRVEPDGAFAEPRLFVEEGGEVLAVDTDGRVYLAAGQIRVFDPAGKRVGVIGVPQRPTSLVFGGPDRKTLFTTARSALYGVRIR